MKHFSPLHVLKRSWLPRLLAPAGFLTFGLQLFLYARTQTTFVDEGMYLYLGYRFVSGSLSYSQLGAWNYYAPLSYFIPGLAQFLFGPGLATGRYFSIACALLAASAIWILARRLRGEWWAAAALWALALTPLQIKMYTLGLSQALTACLLSWTFVLVIGEKRSTGQILAGGLLAGLTVMTRHNLAFLLPALVGYLFWQHGRRAALLALAASLLPILTGMVLFWSSSLRLWTLYWLPQQWFPALSRFGPPPHTQSLWQVNLSLSSRFSAFFLALRAHFLVLAGAGASLFIWPFRWRKPFQKKTALFLAGFFSTTLLLHTLILFSQHPDIFAFAPYVALFSPAGLLLVILTLPESERQPNPVRSIAILFFLLLLALAPAYLDKIGDRLLALPVPRISNGLHLGEWSFLGSYLNHWFDLDYAVLRQVVPPIFFLSAGLLWLLILAGLYTLLKRHNKGFPLSFAPFTLQVSLASGFILSPTLFNAPYRQDQECGQDMFAYYRELGTDLANLIPSGSRVYWQVQSAAPLLYLPPVEIWPTQVYNVYSYRLGGDPQQVEASGYWNADLAREWAKEADFLVLEGEQSYTPVTAEFATVNGYEQIGVLRPINPCAYLHTPVLVFRKTR